MSLRTLIVVLALGAVALSGCPKKTASPPPPEIGPTGQEGQAAENAPQKVKVTAYINVSSGCQASTVKLVDDLAVKYVDLVDVEVVNFGSPEGYRRWQGDGMECMAILFDNGKGPSPALKFKGRDGKKKTHVFFMPAGFSWEHEDLEDAFAALKDGKLTILSEDEAKGELAAAQPIKIIATVKTTDKGAQVMVGDEPVLTVKAKAGEASAADRAETARKAITEWATKPVLPGDIQIAEEGAAVVLKAGHVEIITVTAEDAKQASAASPKELAMDWAGALKKAVVSKAKGKETGSEAPRKQ